MPLTSLWRQSSRRGYQVAAVTNPSGPLTGAFIAAASIKGIMDRLGPGYETVVSVKLPGVGWRQEADSFAAAQPSQTSCWTRTSMRGWTGRTDLQGSESW